MDYTTRNGWTIRFRKNVHMYYHSLQASKAGRTLDVQCEDGPEGYTGIWVYPLNLAPADMQDLLAGLREWARQSGLDYQLFATRDDVEERLALPARPVSMMWRDVAEVDAIPSPAGPIDEDLRQFFGAYFDQDWKLDAADWQDVVRRFAGESGPERQALVAARIRGLLAGEASDARLAATVQAMGCYFWAGSPSETRQWLVQLADRLERSGG
jgi:hypothetical protein